MTDRELKVGDWTVIAEQIMEVTGFAPDGTVIVRPLLPSTEMPMTLQAGWAGDGSPVQLPVAAGPPLMLAREWQSRAEQIEAIREAMLAARANPGREIIFGPIQDLQDPPEE
jgi:hypothetical protein